MIHKSQIIKLTLILIVVNTPVFPAQSAEVIRIFDGTYTGTINTTSTETHFTDPPQKIIKTSSSPITITIKDGVIDGDAFGEISDDSGNFTLHIPNSGYGNFDFLL